jgi:signal transduction histidine kinase
MHDARDPDPASTAPTRLTGRVEALWPLLYAVAWLALHAVSGSAGFLPAGLRLGALMSAPRRLWWQLAAAECVAASAAAYWHRDAQPALAYIGAAMASWCLYAALVRWRGPVHPVTANLPRIASQLATGGLAAAAAATVATAVALAGGLAPREAGAHAFDAALAELAGIVALMPLVFVVREHWWNPARLWSITLAGGIVVLPAVAVAALFTVPAAPAVPLLLLAAAALAWIAQRDGWRAMAVALGVLAITAGLAGLAREWLGLQPAPGAGRLALLVAAFGALALLLAVNADAVRVERLTVRTYKDRLWVQAQQLRAAATRLASQQEHERRHLGAELHDALGQDMTAIATRLHLIQRRAPDSGLVHELGQLRALVDAAHSHLRDAINHLHPVTVTRFGLVRALTIGPVAEMTRAAGVRYECRIHGPVERLPVDVATMLYRVGQEAATNAVRHGCGGYLRLEITLGADADAGDLVLSVTDHAGELDVPPERLGHGLQSIRDRADALAATYHFNARSGLPRHRLELRVRLATAEDDRRAGASPSRH